ncbi:S8 family peptidase [Desulfovibrio fairfieldensis]|uniref:S8 family peptidase n=1 Tax=Desulfovibrio fairfieldensis TaxID=44742 RepID=UPI000AD21BF5|nr:S8 family peptidase [Desulfovibrio fairfieldensis]
MANRPLLLFPTPESAPRATLPSGFPNVRKPSAARQWDRLSPQFQQLQKAFEDQRVRLQQNAAGIEPEQVLVIETIGSVQDFANAVKKIQGFEWMGEVEGAKTPPDDDFYDERHHDHELGVQLYMIMSNQRALEEMLALWKRYKSNPGHKLKRGLTKFRDVFLCLKDIRRWGLRERLLETGLLEIWKEDLANDPERNVRFETELWFRENADHRAQRAAQIISLIEQMDGRILSQAAIPAICYHAILGELPAAGVKAIIDDPNTELTLCDDVMFFRPVGQMSIGTVPSAEETEPAGDVDTSMPIGDPVVALLDGMPLANHRLLANRMIIDDPDNFEEEYAASERIHGTSMASLIAHGDLSVQSPSLSRPIYVRPIMKPIPSPNQPRPELMPEDRLAVDLIHSAVKRLFEGENGEPPVSPSVRVINLSIGDERRPFIRAISPFARLLDWLSAKYGVLFIVSAGNHLSPIELDPSLPPLESLPPDELERAVIKSLYGDAWSRRLLAPAEAINPLTVGALHHDKAPDAPLGAHRINPLHSVLPSPVSAFGSGYSRSIKPDLLYSGGRQCYPRPMTTVPPQKLELRASYKIQPGNKFASPSTLVGELNATVYGCGTSNAAALMSRNASICYDTLEQIFDDQTIAQDMRKYEAPLLKAMLVHGCSWGDIGIHLIDILNNTGNGARARTLTCNWLGYGAPDIDRVFDCTEQRATLLGFGELTDGHAHIFNLPIPPSLGSRRDRRRLTVTLAWLSPIAAQTQKYRATRLWFTVPAGSSLTPDRQEACGGQGGWQTVQRGTVQHEIFEGSSAEPIGDGDRISIQVNCREDAKKTTLPVPYGLLVSLEVAEGLDLPIYNEVRTRITPAIQIQQTRE